MAPRTDQRDKRARPPDTARPTPPKRQKTLAKFLPKLQQGTVPVAAFQSSPLKSSHTHAQLGEPSPPPSPRPASESAIRVSSDTPDTASLRNIAAVEGTGASEQLLPPVQNAHATRQTLEPSTPRPASRGRKQEIADSPHSAKTATDGRGGFLSRYIGLLQRGSPAVPDDRPFVADEADMGSPLPVASERPGRAPSPELSSSVPSPGLAAQSRSPGKKRATSPVSAVHSSSSPTRRTSRRDPPSSPPAILPDGPELEPQSLTSFPSPLGAEADDSEAEADNAEDEGEEDEPESTDAEKDDEPAGDTVAQALHDSIFLEELSAQEYPVKRILAHRPHESIPHALRLLVAWAGSDEQTWESERSLQGTAPAAVYRYWAGLPGGRVGAVGDGPGHIFKVLAHRARRRRGSGRRLAVRCHVQWEGYPDTPAGTTWETEAMVRSCAPLALGAYWVQSGGREAALARR